MKWFLTLTCVLLSFSPIFAATIDTAMPADSFSLYWHNFIKWWRHKLETQNGVVMTALVVGAISIFIITRGKWRK